MVDLVVTRWRLPWATATAAVLLYAARFTHELIPFSLHQLGILRLVFAIGVPVVVLADPGLVGGPPARPPCPQRGRSALAQQPREPQWLARHRARCAAPPGPHPAGANCRSGSAARGPGC